jgi:hypothetical protein
LLEDRRPAGPPATSLLTGPNALDRSVSESARHLRHFHADGLLNARFHFGRGREGSVIRKLKSGQYRLYSRKINPKTGKRRNLGTFPTREAAERHERAVQFFKRSH